MLATEEKCQFFKFFLKDNLFLTFRHNMEQMLPQPEVKVKDIKDSLQVHEVSDDGGRGKGPAGLATQPVQGQRLITTELTCKLQTENGKEFAGVGCNSGEGS